MTGYVVNAAGTALQMPTLLRWELNYTAGTPCDSFTVCALWGDAGGTPPEDLCRFYAQEGTETVFTGIIDEWTWSRDETGCLWTVTGRGMAALLLDNEAQGADYQVATLADILDNHVAPYGIEWERGAALPPVADYTVETGSSQWKALHEFARYHGGVSPRFDRQGRLLLSPWGQEVTHRLGPETPVCEAVRRETRYGVRSEIVVRSRGGAPGQRICDPAAQAAGIVCSRVLTLPGRGNYHTARYTGAYQLARSAAQWKELELILSAPFWGRPGELMELARPDWGICGVWRISQVSVRCGEQGAETRLILAGRDAAL